MFVELFLLPSKRRDDLKHHSNRNVFQLDGQNFDGGFPPVPQNGFQHLKKGHGKREKRNGSSGP